MILIKVNLWWHHIILRKGILRFQMRECQDKVEGFFLGIGEFKLETEGYLELDTRDSRQKKYHEPSIRGGNSQYMFSKGEINNTFEEKCPGSNLKARCGGTFISKYGVQICYFGLCIEDIVGLGRPATLPTFSVRNIVDRELEN